jgi:putative DNA primase/helicase
MIKLEVKEKPRKKAEAKQDLKPIEMDKHGYVGGYFRPLGHAKTDEGQVCYYFFSRKCSYILRFTASKLQKQYLLQLAPMEYWANNFGNKNGGIDSIAAADFIVTCCEIQGHFEEQAIRGRGAWKDSEKTVIHLGDKLLIEGHKSHLAATELEGCYELRRAIKYNDKPLTADEARLLNRILQPLAFGTKADAILLSGWLFVAPLSGILPWRPHMWVTGPTGGGKTWIFDDICSKILEGISLRVQGDSSAAGVRGMFNGDAIPVLFDEAEGENERAQERMQYNLQLARAASAGNGAPNVKGQKDGGSIAHVVKSCFLMCSIVPQLKHGADIRRFTVVNIERMGDKSKFEKLDKYRKETLTKEYCQRWQSRCFALADVCLQSIDIFIRAVSALTNNRATGNQLGVILGGWWHTWNDAAVTAEQALQEAAAVLEAIGYDESGTVSDEAKALQFILGTEIRSEGKETVRTFTIGELANIVIGQVDGQGLSSDEAKSRLRRLGITVRAENGKDYLAVLSSSRFVASVMRGTFAGDNFASLLHRLEGAFIKQVNYGSGLNGRSVHVPARFWVGGGEV